MLLQMIHRILQRGFILHVQASLGAINLAHQAATGADAGAEHARSAAIFLSGGQPQKNSVRVGVTVDQVAAEHIGQDTPLPSLELAIEDVSLSCGAGYEASEELAPNCCAWVDGRSRRWCAAHAKE